MRRGQIAIEHLFLIGALILVSVILMYYGAKQLNETHKISKAEDAVSHLVEKVNEMASLTTGTRDTVWIEIPSRVLEVRLSERHISLVIILANGEQYIFTKEAFAHVTGQVNFSVGLQQLFVTKINDTTVKIGTEPMILDIIPQCIAVSTVSSDTNVTLLGVDFQPLSQPMAGNEFPPYTYVNSATIDIAAEKIHNLVGTDPVNIALDTPPNLLSNSICFHIHSDEITCSCIAGGMGGEEE